MRRRPSLLLTAAAAALLPMASHGAAQTLRGTLLERETDRPISLALVLMLDARGDTIARAISDDQGRFTLTSRAPGDFVVHAEALGYETRRAGVFELGEGGEISFEFRLTPDPLAILGLEVAPTFAVREPPLVRNGFFDRLTQGVGHFITPGVLEESRHHRITDVLAEVPFLTLVNAHPSDRILIQDGGALCTPSVVVDGLLSSVIEGQRRRPGAPSEISGSEGNVEALVNLKDVEAIEVYRSAEEIPSQFGAMSWGGCGAIIIWTKRR